MHGYLSAIWYGRIWVAFPITIVAVNTITAHLVNSTSGETPMMRLNPLKTVEGYGAGILASLLFFFLTLHNFVDDEFYTQGVDKLTFPPCVLSHVETNQRLFGV